MAAAARAQVPLVQHARIASVEDIGPALLQAERVIAVSRFVAERVGALGVRDEVIRVVYNPVDTAHFRPEPGAGAASRRSLGLPTRGYVVLMVARLTPFKRHEVLFEAAVLLRAKHVPIHLALLGEPTQPEYSRWVRALAGRLDLEGDITWLPFQPDMRRCLSAADVLVLCSRNEPAARSVLEAMAMGLPCVAADSGGMRELVDHDRTGWLFPEGDSGALADALQRLWQCPDVRQRVGDQARHEACVRFDHRHAALATQAIFEEVARSSTRRGGGIDGPASE
jgi:glycosyltransferase involved in cell wall biosynthesis